jgi:hypothetical protein
MAPVRAGFSRRAPWLAALAVLAACDGSGGASSARPRADGLNEHVPAVVATYRADGTHRYHWPRTGTWLGNPRPITYAGEVFAEGDPEGRCHCSGLTFAVFLAAWERACRAVGREPVLPGVPDLAALRRLQRAWFGEGGDRRTLSTALVEGGLGEDVPDPLDARAGDFLQLWRHSGSGHSAVFLSWVREGDVLVGVRYWSTQSSTGGIGVAEERFGTSGRAVKRDELRVCRAHGP